MTFDRSYSAGVWWATPHGNTVPLLSLVRHETNLNILALAGLVKTANEVANLEAKDTDLALAYELLKAAPPNIVARLARHPSFGYWAWATRHLLRVKAGFEELSTRMVADASPADLLMFHLADLHRFALTTRILALENFTGSLYPVHEEILVLPTTGLALKGIEKGIPLRISSVASERGATRLSIQQGNRRIVVNTHQPWNMRDEVEIVEHESEGIRNMRVPGIHGASSGFELDACDPYFRGAWVRHEVFPDGSRAPIAQEQDLDQWTSTLRNAMDLLRCAQPQLAAEVALMIQSIVPVTSSNKSKSLSVSAPEFWGAMQCTLDPAPMMGEVMVHEYRHNLLHALNRLDPIFTDDSPNEDEFYSPWRNDDRPLPGILHAMFTFLAVVTYYRGLLQDSKLSDQNRRAARRRAAAHTLRLQLAVKQFEIARLTTFGRGLFDGIRSGIDTACVYAKELQGPDTEDAINEVRHHAEQRNIPVSA